MQYFTRKYLCILLQINSLRVRYPRGYTPCAAGSITAGKIPFGASKGDGWRGDRAGMGSEGGGVGVAGAGCRGVCIAGGPGNPFPAGWAGNPGAGLWLGSAGAAEG